MARDEYPTVEAPRSGKRVRYLDTADRTDGEAARFEMWLAPPPESAGPMRHVHPEQDEDLEVVAGTLGVWHEGTTRTLGPGESVTIPAGDAHRFWNAGDDELHLIGEVRPALDTEAFMYVTYGLAGDHLATASGMPLNPLLLAPVLAEYDDLLYLAVVPVWLQKLAIRLVAPAGRALGYGASYPEYVPAARREALAGVRDRDDDADPGAR
ncbi:cupin domain-containing protein [Halobaculum litoreum]|uniref:Cupin domain-containing protein n=1 Tax=Halobaculum litoreum TaxID=3031998 RepID=A0ABD5XN75_9EURY|nr:cupin domain-containing protein [Halobaculum sp. DT92]